MLSAACPCRGLSQPIEVSEQSGPLTVFVAASLLSPLLARPCSPATTGPRCCYCHWKPPNWKGDAPPYHIHWFRVCTEVPIGHILGVMGHHPPIHRISWHFRPQQTNLVQLAIVFSRQRSYASSISPEVREEVLLGPVPCKLVPLQVPQHLEELPTVRPHQHQASVNAAHLLASAGRSTI